MRAFPSLTNDELRTCSACSLRVVRQDCHRNRYAQYICRNCQAKGVKFTWFNRLGKIATRALLILFACLAGAGLVLLVLWVVYSVFLHVDFFRLLR